MYEVIKKFKDKYTGIIYEINDIFPNSDYKELNKKRTEMLLSKEYIKEVEKNEDVNPVNENDLTDDSKEPVNEIPVEEPKEDSKEDK